MKVIIAGSRDGGFSIKDVELACRAWETTNGVITEVVSGTARGPDQFGETYAINTGTLLKQFPAEWDKHGKSAGYKRNSDMADYADALIALWDGNSRGTKHMIDLATRKGIPVYIYSK